MRWSVIPAGLVLAVSMTLSVAAASLADAEPTTEHAATPTAARVAYAPVNRQGPALSVRTSKLKKALSCHGDFKAGTKEPVLLSPGTGVTPEQDFSWNYERAFAAQGRPYCTITMPQSTMADIQVAGEYLVYAIRTMHRKAGRKVAVLGHSQGGMSMRWALRFWPDTRSKVDDVIGMAASNHGTTMPTSCSAQTTCTPAVWQQMAGSDFLNALNSTTETFKKISYTEIYTHNDEVVTPSTGTDPSPAVAGGSNVTNIAIQQICPASTSEHVLVGTSDATAYALVMDALKNPGPAKASRIASSVCDRAYAPHVKVSSAKQLEKTLQWMPILLAMPAPFINVVGADETAAEPALACYVFASGCP